MKICNFLIDKTNSNKKSVLFCVLINLNTSYYYHVLKRLSVYMQ